MKKINREKKRNYACWAQEFNDIKDIWSTKIRVPKNIRSEFKMKESAYIVKIFMTILQFFRFFSLSKLKCILRDDKDIFRSTFIESYVLVWFGFLILLLNLYTLCPLWCFIAGIVLFIGLLIFRFCLQRHKYFIVLIVLLFGLFILGIDLWHPWYFIVGIVIYRLIDFFSTQLGIIFIDRLKNGGIRSLNRSLLLLGINYFEIIVGFAIMYLATRSLGYSNCNNIITTPTDALYFSAVTITTLGCCDMKPISPWGMGLAALEPILGLIIIALVLHELLKK